MRKAHRSPVRFPCSQWSVSRPPTAVPAWQSGAAYTEVPEWPLPATTAAGTPSAWNLGQVVAVATGADGNILALHRGAQQPILVFEPDGAFVRGWGRGAVQQTARSWGWRRRTGRPARPATPRSTGRRAATPAARTPSGSIRRAHVPRVVDAPGHVIYKLRETGELLMELGTRGVLRGPPRHVQPAHGHRLRPERRHLRQRRLRQRPHRAVLQRRPLHRRVGLAGHRAGRVRPAARHRGGRRRSRLRRRPGQPPRAGVRRRRDVPRPVDRAHRRARRSSSPTSSVSGPAAPCARSTARSWPS